MRFVVPALKLASISMLLIASLMAQTVRSAASPWNFTVKVGLPADLEAKYGGPAQMEADVEAQLAQVNVRFSGFARPITFTVTEFYTYNGDPKAAIVQAHPETNFVLIYSEKAANEGGWYGREQAIIHGWAAADGGVFSANATDGLTHEFGHSRGAVDVYDETVTAANNPVSHETYTPPAGIMTYPYGVSTWDAYSTGVINAGKDSVSSGAPVVDTAFPGMQVVVRTAAGRTVSGAQVQLYPEAWGSGEVSTTPTQSGVTGADGRLALDANPFAPGVPGQSWNLAAPNFVVKVVAGGETGYGFLPLSSVGGWYFTHPGQVYTLAIAIK